MSITRDDELSGAVGRAICTPLYPGLAETASRLHVVLLVPRRSPKWLADFTELAMAGRSVIVSVVAIEGEMPSGDRSEEHTSELQSLMRISYAVFCLKK